MARSTYVTAGVDDEVDGDGNGKLDREELGVLVQEMRKSMGLDYLNAAQVAGLGGAGWHGWLLARCDCCLAAG